MAKSKVLDAVEALQRLADAFARRRAQLARGAGLTEAQWRVLEEIARDSFMPSLFARAKETSAAAVSKVTRQLLELGLVEVAIGESDARQRRFTLSAAGRRALASVEAGRAEALEAVWSELDPAALERFRRFATELAGRLEAFERSKSEIGGQKKTARRRSLRKT